MSPTDTLATAMKVGLLVFKIMKLAYLVPGYRAEISIV